ncbi:MAG TPA: CheW domain-containing protein, partial [Actinomycetota bacterium]|nr:CheW domain-containing protein [Actinomycetota bacterium]
RTLAVLKQRARALARPLLLADAAEGVDVVTFALGDERYGVRVSSVIETLPLEKLVRVPSLPRWWAGVVNVRGIIHPVLDVHRYLDLPREPSDEPAMLILVAGPASTLGLKVDRVDAIVHVPLEDLKPNPPGVTPTTPAVSVVTPQRIAVLDVAQLIDDPRLTVREESM